jgi:hypothetical protein
VKKNRFSKALKHLKSTELDDKIQRLNEGPTNSIDGVYALNPSGFKLGPLGSAKVFYPDVDGNWPAGIPGTPGELSYIRPPGHYDGEKDWDSIVSTDFSQDYLLNDPTGTSTAGLIAADGTVLSQLPPGGQGFILGPLVDGYVRNHGYDDYTNIGYLQKDTRQFVLLARIQGHWSTSITPSGFTPNSAWDGTSGQLTIYNQNFTLAMAEWFRDQVIVSNNFTTNVPYFYSGGVPQIPQSAADCPNCPPGMYGGNAAGSKSFGQGGNPNIGNRQNPNHGGPKDAGYPWGLPPEVADQRLRGGKTASPVGDLAILLTATGIVGAAALAFKAAVAAGGAAALGAIASRLRYLAKLRVGRGALNPFGQTAVRSGAAGRQRIDVYTGRPYQGPRGNRTGTQYGTPNPQTGNTYTNPGPLRGMPGTGSQTNPAGTLDKGTLPQRYLDKYGSGSVLGQKQVKMSPSAARRTFGESVDMAKINDLSNEFIEKLFSQYSDPYEKVDELLSNIEKYLKSENKILESNEAFVLSEDHKKILREIKQPVVVKEQPRTQKLEKYRPNFAGKYTSQNTPDVTACPQSDEMVKAKNAAGQTWRLKDRHWSRYESTERMNIIFDNVGHGSQYWDMIINENQNKKGIRDRAVQEHLNMIAHNRAMLSEDPTYQSPFRNNIEEQETIQADQDPLFKKVAKRLKPAIDYPNKPSPNGFPTEPPPEMIDGWHPEYGNKSNYYNTLDPHSANSMPATGNAEIDAKVRRAKTLKRVLGKRA